MLITFTKYHGTGNDFIIIDERIGPSNLSNEQIRALCDRRFGIGADGLMLLQNDSEHDFRMVYYNSDGNESTMCGNGGRCMISFAHELGLTGVHSVFSAIDGLHEGIVLDNGHIRLRMKDVALPKASGDFWFVDTGSPHIVSFVDETNGYPVVEQGRKIRHMEEFGPGGVNVDFVKKSGDGLWVLSYERGVEDETLSCGTGVTASVIARAFLDPEVCSPVKVQTKGGSLSVSFSRYNDFYVDVWLEGPATKVFKGEISV